MNCERLKLIVSVMLMSVCTSFSFSDSASVKGKGVFQIDVDVAEFYGNESQVYVELYYGIREAILSYRADSSRFVGGAKIRFEVRKDTAVVASKEWTVPHTIEDTAYLERGQTMTGLESFGLPVGKYTLSMAMYDVNAANRKDTVAIPLSLNAYPPDREALSDVELCISIESSSNKQSMFYKNTLEVIPNPSKLYGMGVPILYYYLEAYNLKNSQNKNAVTLRTSVTDALGKEVIVQNKSKPRHLNSSVEIGTVNLNSLKGGTYFLHLTLVDSTNAVLASSSKKFFIYKPQMASEPLAASALPDFTGSEYAVMNDSDIGNEFLHARYIATETEKKQYLQLSELDAKRRFLYDFWKRRDEDPTTVENEFKENYKKRVIEADKSYTKAFREGWKSEQGRVYILYGQPDEVERFPSSAESNPYEIWHYNNIQGGVIFVFVDRRSMDDYILVHSTHRDELHDENWFQEYAQKMQ